VCRLARAFQLTLCFGGLILPGLAPAQEALRHSLEAEIAATQVREQFAEMPYTFRWGDFKTMIEGSLTGEWIDNVSLAEATPESDFILWPVIDLVSMYPVGQRNVLQLFTRAGYRKYLSHSQYDRATVQPGSALSFDVFVKDIRINLHERFSYEEDPIREGAVSGVASYGGFSNVAGTSLLWNLRDVTLKFDYDYFRFVSSSDLFHNDRSSHLGVMGVGWRVHPSATIGLEFSANATEYDETFFNDNVGYSAGVYAQWQLTDYISIQPRAGYALYTFSRNELFGTPADFGAYYWDLRLNHRIGQAVNYTLSGSRSIQLGINANLSDRWSVRGQINWAIIPGSTLATGLFYESGRESAGGFGDNYDRWGGNIGIGYQIMEKLRASLTYGVFMKTSVVASRDYNQNRVTLTLSYRL